MAWTAATRGDYVRPSGSYASDVTDREWALIAPLLPAAQSGGRPRTTCLRRVVNAVFYLLQAGCQWRMLPRDFPPRSTVYGYFRAWIGAGVWAHVHDVLYRRTRELEGRDESPTAAIIDSQSVKTSAEAGEMVGYDAGKRVKGRKRHLVTDTLGLMLRIEVHSASVQDRDGAALVLDRITRRFPFLERIFADAGYQGPRVAAAAPRSRRDHQAHRRRLCRPAQALGDRAHLRLGLHQPPSRPRRRARRRDRQSPLPDRHDQAHDPSDRTLPRLLSQTLKALDLHVVEAPLEQRSASVRPARMRAARGRGRLAPTGSRFSALFPKEFKGGVATLTPLVLVRIQVPQPPKPRKSQRKNSSGPGRRLQSGPGVCSCVLGPFRRVQTQMSWDSLLHPRALGAHVAASTTIAKCWTGLTASGAVPTYGRMPTSNICAEAAPATCRSPRPWTDSLMP